ncbi:MAG: hypothetical protein AB1465_02775 [Patescibacteria group bacterium]
MQNNLSAQEQSILSTITFFDIFNYPLTLFEMWKWQYKNFQFPISNFQSNSKSQISNSKISEIQKILENNENLRKVIESKNGFYFLQGREELVARRRDLYRNAEERWKKLQRVANILQYVPNVKMIAACNTLPINDFKPESDIDAFIIVKKNRIWQTRFFVTALVGLLGQWRHKKNIAKKICLSFYVTDDALNLEPIAKKPYDIYLAYWIALVAPLYVSGCHSEGTEGERKISLTAGGFFASAQDDVYRKFLHANSWVKNYLPNFIGFEPVEFERKVGKSRFFDSIKEIKEKISDSKIGDWFEKFFKKIQKNKMGKNYQSAYRRGGSNVIISDQILKFHEIDRRDEFRKIFELKLAKILNIPTCG